MKKSLRLVCVFLIFTSIFVINLIIPINKSSTSPYIQRLFLICLAVTLVITIYMILKTKKLERKDILIGILFGLIAGVTSPFNGLITTIAYIGLRCMFKYSGVDIPIFKDQTFKGIMKSTILAAACGVTLGIINLFIAMTQYKLSVSFSPMHLINALRAGVSEEIVFRLFMFAICVYLLNGNPKSKMENLLCYTIMVIPHTLIHLPDMIAKNGIVSVIGSVIMLSLLFGLPFALLQRKRDLFSAITAHTLVDLIRFICLGV